MKRLIVLGAICGLFATVLSPAWAATNFSTSRSNNYRLTYPTDLLGQVQATALLGELNKLGRIDEAQLRQWVTANAQRHGIAADRIKKIVILLPGREREQTYKIADPTRWVILLTDPADESPAIALTVKAAEEELASETERREGEMDGDDGGGYGMPMP